MRVSDELMFSYYELLTDKTMVEIETMRAQVKNGTCHPRDLKVQLAKVLVERFHDSAAAEAAEVEFQRIFVQKGVPDDMPEIKLKAQEDLWVCHLLVQTKLASSTSEARRLIQGGAVEKDSEKLLDDRLKINLHVGDKFVLKAGKKKFVKVYVQ
jgi:tyrosyl-tRNA synthetase